MIQPCASFTSLARERSGPMELSLFAADVTTYPGGLLAIGRFEDQPPSAEEQALDAALGGALGKLASRKLFRGKPRQAVALDTLGRLPFDRVLVVGLGQAKTLAPAGVRDFGAAVAREARAQRLGDLAVVVPAGASAVDVVLGLRLGAWQYTTLQTPDPEEPRATIARAALVGATQAELDRADLLAESVILARQLTNEPAHVCTPTRMADVAETLAEHPHVSVMILDRAAIESMGMGGLKAVSQGSTEEPRFIHVSYLPPGADPEQAIALVGKGLTFDSGGLSIKTMPGMVEMYMDMAGGAAVLGAMHALVRMQPKLAIHGVVAACENSVDGNSFRPSDVLTTYSGKTVEVLNTDAEGRLVLADAIHFATQLKPRLIVDLATLTGACLVGLGQYYSALYSDDDAVAAEVSAAGRATDEKFWRMPLDPKLAKSLDSKRADMTNLGGRWGGSITAAQFLQKFKGDRQWCHLDIAGPAMSEAEDGHICHGGTGFGVLTLVALIEAAAQG